MSADVLAEDLLSKSLGDTFFVNDGTTESYETPLERVECFDSDGCHADEFFCYSWQALQILSRYWSWWVCGKWIIKDI